MKAAKSTAFSNLGDSTAALVQQEPALLDEWSVNMLTKAQGAPSRFTSDEGLITMIIQLMPALFDLSSPISPVRCR